MPAPDRSSDYFLDAARVRRAFDRASATFDTSSAVHADIRDRLIERLDIVRIEPACVLDLGAGTGHGTRELKRRYRSAQVVALDISPRMLALAGARSGLFHRFARIAADAQQLPLRNASVDLIFSNLMLQWLAQPDAVIAEARRVLKPGGLLTFTSLGPDSLRELRSAWTQASAVPHVHAFIDMHDLGDALMRGGFAEPVMDTQRLTITYRDWETLRSELRGSGSSNLAYGRSRGLTGRTANQHAHQALQNQRRNGVFPVTLEVVFGHAWAGANKRRETISAEVAIPVASIRHRARSDN